MTALINSFADGFNVARRNMIKVIRVPEILVSVLVTPVIMVVMFAFVFGGAIDIPGGSYREFLVAGAFAMSLSFGATFTGAGLAEDMQKGIVDRFRSLPMSRSAVVFGRTASDVLYNVLTLAVMAGAGLLVGWRIHNGLWSAFAGFALLLGFAYAISWIMAYVALVVSTPEVVNNAAIMVIFPMTFLANTFVPSETLPGPLRAFAEWNPVSAVAHLGLIHIMFPNAPIIHCRRDPMATGLSCFTQMFTAVKHLAYTYDLSDLGFYYRQYERLMDHWRAVLPAGRVFEVVYEEMVTDQEVMSRKVIEHIGLPWDDACLEFYKIERSVRTASIEQVRKPVYRSSVEGWRQYEKHLGPLREALAAGA